MKLIKARNNYRILIVDDEPDYRRAIGIILENAGYKTISCENGKMALKALAENHIALLITDIRMPEMDGVELISKSLNINPDLDIIVVTAYASIENAVDAMKRGATDYFVKSANPKELLLKVNRVCEMHFLKKKDDILVKKQNLNNAFMESKSPIYKKILDICDRVADTDISVLILGESGVGKEVVANYIHRKSKRAKEPFIPVNCQAFPAGVVESELFGHEKGAYTGAIKARVGKFEEANYGTLFMDEIGDIPIETQGKLLRALETKRVERIGSNKTINLDIRYIFATNRDLTEAMVEGRFREDLLYRINTLTLDIPPLRERKEDLPDLINFFIDKISIDQKKKDIQVDDKVIIRLLEYNYPGNIRELRNVIERMIALSKNSRVTLDELLLPTEAKESQDNLLEAGTLRDARDRFEYRFIVQMLRESSWNVSRTAEKMEISSRQLWNKINKYNIKIEK